MSFIRSRWSVRFAAVASLFVLAACSDDDNGGPIGPTPLVAPAGVAAASQGPTSIRVTWNAVPEAVSYEIDRAPSGAGSFASVGTSSTTEYIDTNLEPETEYRYRVRALRGTDQGPYSTEANATTNDRPVVQVTADVTTNTEWVSTNIYQLTRIVSVANGATLTIQPGTRIIGGPITAGEAPPVTALMVLRGSRINAVGTAEDPIIFTSAAAEGQRAPGDWGGLIIVGNARSNRTGRTVVEGPPPADTVGWDGGNLDNDNSGQLVYTRVEFAGAAYILNVELNSYSYYAVGSSTRNEYNQAIRGLDDMFEWFGGTVDGRYLVSYESGDDHFDAAEGYRGRNQFIIALQSGPRVSPRPGNPGALSSEQNGFEIDGCGSASGTCADGFNSTPYSMPVFANYTIIGPGPGVLPARPNGDGGVGMLVRRGTGGVFMNGVVGRWPEAGLSVFDPETGVRITEDSLNIINTLFVDNPRTFDAVAATNRYGQEDMFTGNNILTSTVDAHTLFVNVPSAATVISNGFAFDWRPAAGSELRAGGTGATLPGRVPNRVSNFFGGTLQGTTYLGAIEPDAATQWYTGWTTYYRN